MKASNYDSRCGDLAEYFLAAEQDMSAAHLRESLAVHIQEAVETWFSTCALPDRSPRDLSAVMQTVAGLVPENDPRKPELMRRISSIQGSLDFSAPEIVFTWWMEFCADLERLFPVADEPWLRQIRAFMADKP